MMDRRVRKTREALYSAFISLVVERGYDMISVQDIIDAADVGRTTFYAHFKSKDELLRVGFERLRDDLKSLLQGAGTRDAWAFVEPLLLHAKAHLGLYRALLSGSGGSIAEQEFQAIVEEMVSSALESRSGNRLAVTMLVGALIACVRGWVDGQLLGPAGDIAAMLPRMARAVQST